MLTNIHENLFWAFIYNIIGIRSPKRDHKHSRTPINLPEPEIIKEDTTMTKVITIEGMMCKHCVAHVTKALSETQGVETVEVSLEKGAATVTGNVSDEVLPAAVVDAGYEVKGIA